MRARGELKSKKGSVEGTEASASFTTHLNPKTTAYP